MDHSQILTTKDQITHMIGNTNHVDFNCEEFIFGEYFNYSKPMKIDLSLIGTMRMQDYQTKASFVKSSASLLNKSLQQYLVCWKGFPDTHTDKTSYFIKGSLFWYLTCWKGLPNQSFTLKFLQVAHSLLGFLFYYLIYWKGFPEFNCSQAIHNGFFFKYLTCWKRFPNQEITLMIQAYTSLSTRRESSFSSRGEMMGYDD